MRSTQINPAVVRWARERAGLSLHSAEFQLKLKQNTLEKWETDTTTISETQIEKIAKFYGVPLVAFFLDKVPAPSPIPDFRTPARARAGQPRHLLALCDRIASQQAEAREMISSLYPSFRVNLVGALSTTNTATQSAKKLLSLLSISSVDLSGDVDSVFKLLRTKAEDAGIFVLLAKNLGNHHSNISQEEFSGLALSDDVAPFIVIHADNNAGRRNFTLVHELAHLGLNRSAISAYDPFTLTAQEDVADSIEKYCDLVAAEVLLPQAELTAKWNASQGEPKSRIAKISNNFGASNSAVVVGLRRGKLIDAVTSHELLAEYKAHWEGQQQKKKMKQQETEGGPNYYVVKKNYLGNRIVAVVREAIDEKLVSSSRAARVLGVNPMKLESIIGVTP
jgi:Zn-dependent peptidase ImmA (M78 family)/transcriptional regulator with XRE-family HTH domain